MPVAVRCAGFPTVCLVLTAALTIGVSAPARSALLPPQWRLAILFDREVWAAPAPVDRPVPVRPGLRPVTFEGRAHG